MSNHGVNYCRTLALLNPCDSLEFPEILGAKMTVLNGSPLRNSSLSGATCRTPNDFDAFCHRCADAANVEISLRERDFDTGLL